MTLSRRFLKTHLRAVRRQLKTLRRLQRRYVAVDLPTAAQRLQAQITKFEVNELATEQLLLGTPRRRPHFFRAVQVFA